MDGYVQELANQAEQWAINPENPIYTTNWCDLPVEMQFECIKWMDFKTRTRLGATSHTEKSLVEAKKYHFDSVKMTYCCCAGGGVELVADQEIQMKSINNPEQQLNCLLKILKNCEIDTFEFSEQDWGHENLQEFWRKVEKSGPFRFKTFKSKSTDPKGARLFVEGSRGVENVILGCDQWRCPETIDLLDYPKFLNAKLLQIDCLHNFPKVHKLVQNWIDENAEIGKSIRFMIRSESDKVMEFFAQKFANRVIYKNDITIRIQTNDESKHILIRCDKKESHSKFYSYTIIPSNLLEAEFEIDGKWVEELKREDYEKHLHRLVKLVRNYNIQ